jgi:hypothetical protein
VTQSNNPKQSHKEEHGEKTNKQQQTAADRDN